MRVVETRGACVKRSGLRSIAWILLLTFTLQSVITQTHIHGAFGNVAAASIVKAPAKAPFHKGIPSQNDAADCPFCQAVTHAGAFFTPSAPSLFLSVRWIEATVPFVMAAAIEGFSAHPWRSRAPPRH